MPGMSRLKTLACSCLLAWPYVAAQDRDFGLLLEVPPPITDFESTSKVRDSYSTWFDGCGQQACACGVPPELLRDENGQTVYHVALNVQNTAMLDPHLKRPVPADQIDEMGMWRNGKNCGRWVEITFNEDCLGLGLTASNPPDVCGVNPFLQNPLSEPRYSDDQYSGTKMYAVVADSCQDGNLWCRNDVYHLDLQVDLVNDFCGGGTSCFNSRHLEWRFMDRQPSFAESGLALPSDIQFAWFCSSNFPWHAMLVVYNLPNGISKVRANGYDAAVSNGDAGQQWVLKRQSFGSTNPEPGVNFRAALTVEVYDNNGNNNGMEYYLLLDTDEFDAACASGLNAVPSPALAELPTIEVEVPPERVQCENQELQVVHSQCGGSSWQGDTCCSEGSTCVEQNEYYWQCLASDSPAGPPADPPPPPEPETPPADPPPPPEPEAPPANPPPTPKPETPPTDPPPPPEPETPPADPLSPPEPEATPTDPPPPPEPETPPGDPSCSSLYGQCGGQNWAGATCCTEGNCIYQNVWYSQCIR
eukprot:jgi/Ulvmu1/350/UM001_0355.1